MQDLPDLLIFSFTVFCSQIRFGEAYKAWLFQAFAHRPLFLVVFRASIAVPHSGAFGLLTVSIT